MKSILEKVFAPDAKLPVEELGGFRTIFWNYLLVVFWFILGTIAPFALAFAYLWVTTEFFPILNNFLPDDDSVSQAILVTASFFGGFGLAAWRIARMLKKSGKSVFKTLHINLESFGGRIWPVVLWTVGTLIIGWSLEALVTRLVPTGGDNSTADFIRSLADSYFALGCLILAVVVGAGIFEELLFRGFVFNTLRKLFRAKGSMACFRNNKHLADYAAVCLSSLVFAVVHFQPAAIPAIFVLGCVLCETYRRSGSLIPSILAHSLNNLVAVVILLK